MEGEREGARVCEGMCLAEGARAGAGGEEKREMYAFSDGSRVKTGLGH